MELCVYFALDRVLFFGLAFRWLRGLLRLLDCAALVSIETYHPFIRYLGATYI
jgi:hypothetical protein